ncbi:MAG: ScyD/ScyE family protein [Pseudonocardiales bacterium]
MIRRSPQTALVALVAVVLLALGAAPASAATLSAPLATGLAGPLQFAVASNGSIYVGENFAGRLTKIDKRGGTSTVTTVAQGAEVAGVDARGAGTLVYTTTTGVSEDTTATASGLARALPNGRTSQLADLFAYEQTYNPDSINHYGFSNLDPACAATLPPGIPTDPYAGLLDTHPYAVAIVPGGWVVADAAGNDLLKVTANGRISTLAVLPAQPAVAITADNFGAFGLPACAVGATYTAEPVPTDVEVGPDGQLYVSTLSGEPAPGSVYRVDPHSGATSLIATGFAGATNLAVAPDGTIYVAELFGGQISKVVGTGSVPVIQLPNPAGLEWANGKLYVSYDVFGPDGKIATIAP